MAQAIKELYTLPREEQEFILQNLAHDYNTIEINGDIYMIPQKVNELIDNLFTELQDIKFGKKINKEYHFLEYRK